jgi:hypothetical protein
MGPLVLTFNIHPISNYPPFAALFDVPFLTRSARHTLPSPLFWCRCVNTKVLGYILRDYMRGKRGNYPVIVAEFELTHGRNKGRRIDLVATRKKYGIPDGLLDWPNRKPLSGAISSACRSPVIRAGSGRGDVASLGDSGFDSADDNNTSSAGLGVESAEVSIRETEESEGGGGGVGSPSLCSDGLLEAESPSLYSGDSKASPNPQLRRPPFFAAGPTPEMTPAEQLATIFFGYQGRPAKFDNAATLSSWTTTFNRLVKQYGIEKLGGAMDWSFEVDTFWPKHLIRAHEPLKYFEEKLEEGILSHYVAWQTSERNMAREGQQKRSSNEKPKSFGGRKQPVDNSDVLAEARARNAERYGVGS